MSKLEGIPGINIQWPISELILNGTKVVETRKYPIPKKHIGKILAIIETPGPRGRKEAGIHKARIVGTIIFGGCFRYKSKKEWSDDRFRHCVDLDDPQFGFKDGSEKWGWEILKVTKLTKPKPGPKSKGIVFASNCKI